MPSGQGLPSLPLYDLDPLRTVPSCRFVAAMIVHGYRASRCAEFLTSADGSLNGTFENSDEFLRSFCIYLTIEKKVFKRSSPKKDTFLSYS